MALAGTVFGALVITQIRRMHRTETSIAIVTYFSLFSAAFGLVTLPLGAIFPSQRWIFPGLSDSMLMVAIGIVGGVGQVMTTQSLRHADVSSVAPFAYLSLVWAILFGAVFFGDIPTPAMLAGSVVVIASGLFVVYRERQLKR